MTFLHFLLNRSRLPICSYNLFLFWPVTLKTVKKKSINACILIKKISLKKKKKSIYACVLINKISKKKSIDACILINKISKKKKNIYANIFIQKKNLKLKKKKHKKKKKKNYLGMYIDKQNQLKKKKSTILFYFGL